MFSVHRTHYISRICRQSRYRTWCPSRQRTQCTVLRTSSRRGKPRTRRRSRVREIRKKEKRDIFRVNSSSLLSKKWRSGSAGEKQLSAVLQLERPSVINSIDIGNDGSAFVEVRQLLFSDLEISTCFIFTHLDR